MKFGRIFAFAGALGLSTLAIAASIAGCSSDDDATASTDAAVDHTPVTVIDSGTATTCWDDTQTISKEGAVYKSPNVQPGACTQTDVTNLYNFLDKSANPLWTEVQNEVKTTASAGCYACIFGKESAATWAPVLTDNDGKVTDTNFGGCVEIVSGKGQACGQAADFYSKCFDLACQDCTTDDDVSACVKDVTTTVCKPFVTDLLAACGSSNNISAYFQACYPEKNSFGIDEWIRRSCVVGDGSDAGTDGGADAGDAGDAGDGGQ